MTNEILGGCNILGGYNISSITQQIFEHQKTSATTYTYQPTTIEYSVPDNTSVLVYTHTTGSANVFSSRTEFQSHFALKASIKGSHGAFQAEFTSAYSKATQSENSYEYGMYEAQFTGWRLSLQQTTSDWLDNDFLHEPDAQNSPTTYSFTNREQFFQFQI